MLVKTHVMGTYFNRTATKPDKNIIPAKEPNEEALHNACGQVVPQLDLFCAWFMDFFVSVILACCDCR